MKAPRINIIELRELKIGYGERLLINNGNAGFGLGEFTALIGRNGTGKSTLLRTLAGLSSAISGQILINGKRLDRMKPRELATRISFVSTQAVRIPNLRVADLVGMGRAPYTNWIGRLTEDDIAVVHNSIGLVGMQDFEEKKLDTLSDGERQRVMIARALAQDTPIILLDEPTAFLDLPNRYQICMLLRSLAHTEKKSIIFSTHDLEIAIKLCDMMAVIEGNTLHYGTSSQLTSSGIIDRLFDDAAIGFDTDPNSIKLKTTV